MQRPSSTAVNITLTPLTATCHSSYWLTLLLCWIHNRHTLCLTQTAGNRRGQRWAGSMEANIDFYRHFSWLRKVSAEVLAPLGVWICMSVHVVHSCMRALPLRGSFESRKKANSTPSLGKNVGLLHMHVIVLSFCYISWQQTVSDAISLSSGAELSFRLLRRHKCYQVGGIIHQLILVNKTVADTAGFNQRLCRTDLISAHAVSSIL